MESALNKIGIFDFFGVFLSGMSFLTICYYLDLPLCDSPQNTNNDIIGIVLFMLQSYLIGLVFQEISSVSDKKLFKIRENAETSCLDSNSTIFDNELELKSIQKEANVILGIETDSHVYTKTENRFVYQYCKNFLEVSEKSVKVSRMTSLYAMSRSLFVSLSVCLCFFVKYNLMIFSMKKFMVLLILALLIHIFYERTKRLYRYKVCIVLRLYTVLKDKNI